VRKSHFDDEFLVLLGPIISRLFTCSNEEKKLKKKKQRALALVLSLWCCHLASCMPITFSALLFDRVRNKCKFNSMYWNLFKNTKNAKISWISGSGIAHQFVLGLSPALGHLLVGGVLQLFGLVIMWRHFKQPLTLDLDDVSHELLRREHLASMLFHFFLEIYSRARISVNHI